MAGVRKILNLSLKSKPKCFINLPRATMVTSVDGKRPKILHFSDRDRFYFAASSGLTEDQVAIQQLASDFAKNEMLPHMAKWDQEVLF